MTPNDRLDPTAPPRVGYRRYWDTYNRPYSGCGCLWIIIIIFFIWWIVSWAIGGGGFWGSWHGNRTGTGANPPAATAPAR